MFHSSLKAISEVKVKCPCAKLIKRYPTDMYGGVNV
jgi:hypothetical protein